MFAFFAEHTNISPLELREYTFDDAEFLMEGFKKNNKDNSNTDGKQTLEGLDAIKFLQQNKGSF